MPPIPAHHYTSAEDVLCYYLTNSPPDHALWKTIEWRLFREYDYSAPVLDLGCGDGVFAKLIFEQPLTAGIDILGGRVRKARATGAHALPVTGDATTMPFASASFRTIFSGCAMEHVPPMPQMLAEIARLLQPGGQLITTVPSGYFSEYLQVPTLLRRWGWTAGARWYGRLIPRLLTMVHLYHPAHWRRLLADAGLELIEARHFLPRPATALFDELVIAGNLLQPFVWALRGTKLHRQYVRWLQEKLRPYVLSDAPTGGGLLLVARKPAAKESV